MIVVADSSPLIILSRIGYFDLLSRLYSRIYISAEVYAEVVVAGFSLPGAEQVATADWVEIKQIETPMKVSITQGVNLGAGELSTIALGKEIGASVALIDDLPARRLAVREGLAVRGSVGLLELMFQKGDLADLRSAFLKLLSAEAYIAEDLLDERLHLFGLPPVSH